MSADLHAWTLRRSRWPTTSPDSIQTIEHVSASVTVDNLEINSYHTYIAGGVIVHNKIQPPYIPWQPSKTAE